MHRNRYSLSGKCILSAAFEDSIFLYLQSAAASLACFICTCLTFNYTIFYTQFSYVPSFVSSFSLQRSKNVCRRRLSLIGLIHTYRRWVPCRFNVLLSIYLSIYVCIYRISIDSPLKFAYQGVRHYFFHSFANWRQCGAWPWSGYRIANIFNVNEVHEIVI